MSKIYFYYFTAQIHIVKKNIDRLCEDLFQILDDEPIEEFELKETVKNTINDVFLNYKNLKNDINQNLLGNEIKLKKKLSLNESSSEEKGDFSQSKIYTGSNRRGDPRFYSYNNHKQTSSNDSDDVFSDSNIFKTCSFEDSGISINKKYKDNTTNENFEKWKKVKKLSNFQHSFKHCDIFLITTFAQIFI